MRAVSPDDSTPPSSLARSTTSATPTSGRCAYDDDVLLTNAARSRPSRSQLGGTLGDDDSPWSTPPHGDNVNRKIAPTRRSTETHVDTTRRV